MTTPAYRRATRADLGWRVDRPSLVWAALGGVIAAIVTGIPMHVMGMMLMGPAALVGSTNVWGGWATHLAAGVLFGTPYGLVVHTRRYATGLLYGGLWGLFVGIAFAWFALFTLLGMPLLTMSGAIDVMLHVGWGIVIGLVSAWGLRRTEARGAATRRPHARAAP